MTQKKFDLAKSMGLKINSTVQRGPQGQNAGASAKRAGGSKLLGALLGNAPASTDADAATPAAKPAKPATKGPVKRK